MKIKKIYFLKSCTKKTQFPIYTHPEIAFIGRSNVGKSSLINMIFEQKSLVKTGSRPGVTQTVNFFVCNDNFSIVDLPGYGYAKVPKAIKNKFMPMIKEFIHTRKHLKLVFLLIDIRRIPDDFEAEMLEELAKNKISTVIVITKIDKLSKSQQKSHIQKISNALNISHESFFLTSSQKKTGKKDLMQIIDEYCFS